MKNSTNAIVFAVAIIVASFILGNAVINRNKKEGTISVTGLGQTNFTSDLIVWEAKLAAFTQFMRCNYNDN